MKRWVLFFAILTGLRAQAQQFFFSRENYKDSVVLAGAIPSLAEQVIPLHHNSDKTRFYDEMFRYFMVARQYDHAIACIDSFRRSVPPLSQSGISGMGMHYGSITC